MPEDPRPDFEPDWPVCTETDCRGAQAVGRHCLVHAEDLSGLKPGDDLDLRGTVIDSAKLAEVLGQFRNHDAKRFVFGEVRCHHTWFSGRAWFDGAEFRGTASFNEAHFSHLARFDGATCEKGMYFRETRFHGKALMTPVSARSVDLRGAWFANQVELGAVVSSVDWDWDCAGARFEGGVVLSTRGEVDASAAYFGAPSTILGAKVMSLAGCDVSNLVLTQTDLRKCRFQGAHRLDQLRVDGRMGFAVPEGFGRARRRMLAEEAGSLHPVLVAALYRSLRKSFEDSKNEAGAGDFYYGEMECRRRSWETPRAERVILWFYWLLSGYGQRASRALIALALVVAVVTGLLTVWGQDFGMASRIALSAVVFRDDRTELTAAGEWTVLVARFLGPVLLALAVLAIRARVKR
jgi:uncharacterized protein YjbI with pentapeptide repeats